MVRSHIWIGKTWDIEIVFWIIPVVIWKQFAIVILDFFLYLIWFVIMFLKIFIIFIICLLLFWNLKKNIYCIIHQCLANDARDGCAWLLKNNYVVNIGWKWQKKTAAKVEKTGRYVMEANIFSFSLITESLNSKLWRRIVC